MRMVAPFRMLGFIAMALMWLTAAAPADIGPRPPLRPEEVRDPQAWLRMVAEDVRIDIDGPKAHVTATFQFDTIQELYRRIAVLRAGFPQLRTEPPMTNFRVRQVVEYGLHASKPTGYQDVTDQVKADPPSASLRGDLPASWRSWPVTLAHSAGAPSKYRVWIEVQYDQALRKGADGKWALVYVLRSGAPWAQSIGKAVIRVSAKNARVVAATPKGATVKGDTATWTLTDFEPKEDVRVTVRPR